MQAQISTTLLTGDPDDVGEFVQQQLVGPALDGVVVNLPVRGWDLERIVIAGETLTKALG